MTSSMRTAPVFGAGLAFSVVVLAAYLVLTRWLNVPVGHFLDWVIGLLTFWWLLIVVTVPWNLYFRAKEILQDAKESREKGIPVDESKVAFVARWERRAIVVAIVLHLISAAGLFLLSYLGVSRVGYVSSAAVLLLTGLRPAIRAYDYLRARLGSIHEQLRFPREDVMTLRSDLTGVSDALRGIEQRLHLENPESWAAELDGRVQKLRLDVARIDAFLPDIEARNQLAHENLSRETQHAVSQLTADSKFLENVREIIRFIKSS